MGQKLGEAFGSAVRVDNRPGAGGAIGAETVAKARARRLHADTRQPGPEREHAAHVEESVYRSRIHQHRVHRLRAAAASSRNPKFPPNNPRSSRLREGNPGKVSWGSSGNGSSLHIGLALFRRATGAIRARAVQRLGPALVDTVSGQIQVMHTTTVSAESQIKSGRVKVVGVAAPNGLPLLPDVPTLAESGIKDAEAIVGSACRGRRSCRARSSTS